MENYIEVKTTVKIPNQKIQDLITTAMEGGSNYWARFKFPDNWKEKCGSKEELPFEGGEIQVYDVETEELLGYLSRATIQVGLQLMADGKDMKGKIVPDRHFNNITDDSDDAETADVFLQLSVMGEIVFG